MSVSVMTIDEVSEVSGALSMTNGGNWDNTWTYTGIGAAGGALLSGWPGAAVGGVSTFLGSFDYDWGVSGFWFNGDRYW